MELSSISIAITSLVGALFSPGAIFTTGVNGAWYDPSDINLTWRRNLLTYTEQFDNTAWTKVNATITTNAAIAPDGTMTAGKLKEGVDTVRKLIFQGITRSSTNTISIYAKKGERSFISIGAWDGGLWSVSLFNLNLGTFVGTYTAGGEPANTNNNILDVGNGWYRVSCITTSRAFATFQVSNGGNPIFENYQGDGTSGIYIWGAQLEVGSTATPYQRITDGVQDYLQYQAQPVLFQDAAGTTPVTAVGQPVGLMLDKSGRGNHAFNPSGNSANFPVLQQDGTGRYYLAFNGVNQWLQTNSIDFTYGDKMFVSAGVRKLSDAVTAVYELSTIADTSAGSFALLTYSGQYAERLKGSVSNYIEMDYPNGSAPVSHVVSSSYSLSASPASTASTLRINASAVSGTSSGAAVPPVGGNYGNYPLYIGARAGSSLWFNGRLYGLVVAGKAASASEIASTETWLNQKTGAY